MRQLTKEKVEAIHRNKGTLLDESGMPSLHKFIPELESAESTETTENIPPSYNIPLKPIIVALHGISSAISELSKPKKKSYQCSVDRGPSGLIETIKIKED